MEDTLRTHGDLVATITSERDSALARAAQLLSSVSQQMEQISLLTEANNTVSTVALYPFPSVYKMCSSQLITIPSPQNFGSRRSY
jgi:D-arabinose 5-phosphate isomerase GutQ